MYSDLGHGGSLVALQGRSRDASLAGDLRVFTRVADPGARRVPRQLLQAAAARSRETAVGVKRHGADLASGIR